MNDNIEMCGAAAAFAVFLVLLLTGNLPGQQEDKICSKHQLRQHTAAKGCTKHKVTV